MLTDEVVTAIMTSSITGAGLVIAFYALIARMSDRIFSNKLDQLEERRHELKEIRSQPESFSEKNLKKTSKRLDDLSDEINSIKEFPRYLGWGVIADFLLFLATAFFCFAYLFSAENTITKNDFVIIFLFLGALFVFMVVGVYGIFDILETISTHFEKLKEKKEEAKEEIATAPQEAKIGKQIVHFLNKMGVDYDRETMIKTNGERAFVDFTIYLNKTPEYLVEVLTKPTSQNVYKVSTKLEFYKEITGMKTILISDFSANKPALEAAESYWDYIVDINNLDDLKKILR